MGERDYRVPKGKAGGKAFHDVPPPWGFGRGGEKTNNRMNAET